MDQLLTSRSMYVQAFLSASQERYVGEQDVFSLCNTFTAGSIAGKEDLANFLYTRRLKTWRGGIFFANIYSYDLFFSKRTLLSEGKHNVKQREAQNVTTI